MSTRGRGYRPGSKSHLICCVCKSPPRTVGIKRSRGSESKDGALAYCSVSDLFFNLHNFYNGGQDIGLHILYNSTTELYFQPQKSVFREAWTATQADHVTQAQTIKKGESNKAHVSLDQLHDEMIQYTTAGIIICPCFWIFQGHLWSRLISYSASSYSELYPGFSDKLWSHSLEICTNCLEYREHSSILCKAK